jgi:hypothetical protein
LAGRRLAAFLGSISGGTGGVDTLAATNGANTFAVTNELQRRALGTS